MSNKNIDIFLDEVSSYLNEVPEYIIEDYILENYDPPVHLIWHLDYETLKNHHNQATKLILGYRDEPEFHSELLQLISIRALISMHILLHPLDKTSYGTSKFENSDQSFLNQLPRKTDFHLSQVKRLYQLLIVEGRITKTERKLFISLLFDNNPQKEKILWNSSEADLRGFLTVIIEQDVIKYNITDLNKFASINFKCLDRNKLPKDIKQATFKGLQSKVSFTKAWDFWTNRLSQLL